MEGPKDSLQKFTDFEEANLKLSHLRDEATDTLQRFIAEINFKSSEVVRKGNMVIDALRSSTVPLNYLKLNDHNNEKFKKSLQEHSANIEICAQDLKREMDTLQTKWDDVIAGVCVGVTRKKAKLKECVATQEREDKELLEETRRISENGPNGTHLAKQVEDYHTKNVDSKNAIHILNNEIRKVNAELQREKEFDKKRAMSPAPAAVVQGPSGSTHSKRPKNPNVPPLLQIGVSSAPNNSTGIASIKKKRKLYNPNDLSYLKDFENWNAK